MGKATGLWAMIGASFGACFPVMAIGIRFAQGGSELAMHDLHQDPLIWIICSAPAFLGLFAGLGGSQKDRVDRLNAGLEMTVAERTEELAGSLAELADHSAEQAGLLGGLELGLAYFGADGELSSARSAQLAQALPGSEKVGQVDELLSRFAGLESDTVACARELLWDEVFHSGFRDTISMLETDFEHNGRTLQTRYSPIHDASGSLSKVLLQVLDITQEVEARAEQERMAARMERLSIAAGSPKSFRRFVAEADELILSCTTDCEREEKARVMHTLKGNARMFGFHEVATMVHQAEGVMEAGGSPDPGPIAELFAQQVSEVCEVLGLDRKGDRVSVSVQELESLAQTLPPTPAQALRALTWRAPQEQLRHHLRAVRQLAQRRGVDLALEVTGPATPAGSLDPFHDALGHILTNAVTHGAQSGHPLCLRISLRQGLGLELKVADNGAGIQVQKLVDKAVASGLWSPETAASCTPEQALNLVFQRGLSAKDQVDEAAGRGVGLDAVQSLMQDLGGGVRVQSTPGQGTSFCLLGPATTALAA